MADFSLPYGRPANITGAFLGGLQGVQDYQTGSLQQQVLRQKVAQEKQKREALAQYAQTQDPAALFAGAPELAIDLLKLQKSVASMNAKQKKDATDAFIKMAPGVTLETWPQFRASQIAAGVDPSAMPETFPSEGHLKQYIGAISPSVQKYQMGLANLDIKERGLGLQERRTEAMIGQGERRLEQGERRLQQGERKLAGTGGIGGSDSLTDEALDVMADRFMQTGQIPGFGMGNVGALDRRKFLNRVGEKAKAGDINPAAQAAVYSATKQALGKLKGQESLVMSFVETTNKNLDMVDKLSEKVGRSGVPIINRWIMAGKLNATGDPDAASFNAVIRTAINEYAKVTSSATGGGSVVSDSARKEVEDMLNRAQTPEQVKSVIKTLRQEMNNRREGFIKERKLLEEGLHDINKTGKNQMKASSAPQMVTIRNKVTKETMTIPYDDAVSRGLIK